MNKEVRDKIHRIMDLCLDAKERGHDCFFQFSAYVNILDFNSHLFGWSKERDADCKSIVYINEKSAEEKLDEIINYLETLINSSDRQINIQRFKKQFDSIIKIDKTYMRDFELSNLMTYMEEAFSIPAFNDDLFNNNNPDVIELYKSISNERSFVKELKIV